MHDCRHRQSLTATSRISQERATQNFHRYTFSTIEVHFSAEDRSDHPFGDKSRTQILRKLIGALPSPWACNLIGAVSNGLYVGCPM
jgi:hypothetical protein